MICAMKSNIKWAAVFLVLCVVCAVIWMVRQNSMENEAVAVIKQGNNVIQTINLSDVSEPYEFEVIDENGGRNLIRAEYGKIAVIDADCPDKVCVNQGYIDNSAVPIVCLPHKLSVTITGIKDDVDAVAGD